MSGEKQFFGATNSFRLSMQEQQEFNALFTSLHPEHRPKAMKELFVNMFRTFVNNIHSKTPAPSVNEVDKGVDSNVLNTVDETVYGISNEAFKKVNDGLNALLSEQAGAPVKISPNDTLTAVCEYCLHEDYGKEFPTDEQILRYSAINTAP